MLKILSGSELVLNFFNNCLDTNSNSPALKHTVCARRLNPFYIVTYYIIWVKTSWTYSRKPFVTVWSCRGLEKNWRGKDSCGPTKLSVHHFHGTDIRW